MKMVSFERSLVAATLVLVTLGLVVPLMFIAIVGTPDAPAVAVHSSELTVGIAVIIRATIRRLIRSGASTVMRTTVSTLVRTMARTLTRRVLRMAIRSTVASTGKDLMEDHHKEDHHKEDHHKEDHHKEDEDELAAVPKQGSSVTAVLVGTVALALSFWGILYAIGPTQTANILNLGQLTVFTACVLAALPMLFYALLAFAAARWQQMPIRFATTLEGLLIQGYFTGAGSFLPMTTDIEMEGKPKQKAIVSCIALLGLYGLHLVSAFAGKSLNSPTLGFASGMMLIYCFVYAFPIKPLEGYSIWAYRKKLWALIFLPILLSFALMFPKTLQVIL